MNEQINKPSILIVEDNPIDVTLIQAGLKSDYDILVATDGKQGFDMAVSSKPDCIISDVRMPSMSGFTLLKKLRSNPELSSVPIILLTSLSNPDDRIQGYDLMADLYFTKPVNLKELVAAVRALVRLKKTREPQAATVESVIGRGISEEDQKFLKKVVSAIHERIKDPDLSVQQLAKLAHVSRRQLERRLKELESLTPKEYIRQVRLEHAKKIVDQGLSSSITDLAQRAGFKDAKYFSKLFKSYYGYPPRNN